MASNAPYLQPQKNYGHNSFEGCVTPRRTFATLTWSHIIVLMVRQIHSASTTAATTTTSTHTRPVIAIGRDEWQCLKSQLFFIEFRPFYCILWTHRRLYGWDWKWVYNENTTTRSHRHSIYIRSSVSRVCVCFAFAAAASSDLKCRWGELSFWHLFLPVPRSRSSRVCSCSTYYTSAIISARWSSIAGRLVVSCLSTTFVRLCDLQSTRSTWVIVFYRSVCIYRRPPVQLRSATPHRRRLGETTRKVEHKCEYINYRQLCWQLFSRENVSHHV